MKSTISMGSGIYAFLFILHCYPLSIRRLGQGVSGTGVDKQHENDDEDKFDRNKCKSRLEN